MSDDATMLPDWAKEWTQSEYFVIGGNGIIIAEANSSEDAEYIITDRNREIAAASAALAESERRCEELRSDLGAIAERYERYQCGTTQDIVSAAYDMRCMARKALTPDPKPATEDAK